MACFVSEKFVRTAVNVGFRVRLCWFDKNISFFLQGFSLRLFSEVSFPPKTTAFFATMLSVETDRYCLHDDFRGVSLVGEKVISVSSPETAHYSLLKAPTGGHWDMYLYPNFDADASKHSLEEMCRTALHRQLVVCVAFLNRKESASIHKDFLTKGSDDYVLYDECHGGASLIDIMDTMVRQSDFVYGCSTQELRDIIHLMLTLSPSIVRTACSGLIGENKYQVGFWNDQYFLRSKTSVEGSVDAKCRVFPEDDSSPAVFVAVANLVLSISGDIFCQWSESRSRFMRPIICLILGGGNDRHYRIDLFFWEKGCAEFSGNVCRLRRA